MKSRLPRLLAPALLAAAVPVTYALAQAPAQPPAKAETRAGLPRPSPEMLTRLQDGRMAMIKETLKLNEAQLKLWAPVESQMRTAAAEREKARAEREQLRAQGGAAPSLPDRLERASQRMARRAEQMKAFADAFKPFYASLSDEQKALAGIVLRETRGHHGPRGHGHRWAMHRGSGAPRQ